MTVKQLESRVDALEKAVDELRNKINGDSEEKRPWWTTSAGTFANDPLFDEAVKLGREYRESLHPDYKKKRKKRKQKKKE